MCKYCRFGGRGKFKGRTPDFLILQDRFALKFRTREVWVYSETKNEHGVVSINFLFYTSRMNLKDCESTCYNFDRIIFTKRSEFRKLPKSKNFFLVLKYRKTMRKFLGVTK